MELDGDDGVGVVVGMDMVMHIWGGGERLAA